MSSPSPASSLERYSLDPNEIAKYISLDNCPQFHKFNFDEEVREEWAQKKDWKEAFEPLNMLLMKDGYDFEDACIEIFDTSNATFIDHTDTQNWYDTKPELAELIKKAKAKDAGDDPYVIVQARFGSKIEAWPVYGDADVVIIWPEIDDTARVRILDIKAAYDQKTYQQVQVSVYTQLLRKFLTDENLDDGVIVEGGVWTREADITGMDPEDFPKFNKLNARESDVRRLLKEGGEFDRLAQADNDDVNYQLAPKCYGCTYREACYTTAIEEASTALLGISRGEQQTLAKHGIDTLHDLAELAYPPTDPKPFDYDDIGDTSNPAYMQLVDQSGIGERLPQYIQRAQSMLSRFYENSPKDNMFARNDEHGAPWIVGSGKGSLPADDPNFDIDLPFERGSMIRVYLHVERDHRRDRLAMLSGFATATTYEEAGYDPVMFSNLSAPMPDDDQRSTQIEGRMLRRFSSNLIDTIVDIGDKMGHPEQAPVHFYMFTRQEEESLNEALKRHKNIDEAVAMRDLLGLRHAIRQETDDQAMVSIIQSEAEARKALSTANPGLLPMKEEVYPGQNMFYNKDWTYTRSDGLEVDLKSAFNQRLFDYRVAYEQHSDTIELNPGQRGENNQYYPSRIRQGSHIPLEYVWAGQGKLTDAWVEDANDIIEERSQSLEPYRWIDQDTKEHKITAEDITALGERLAACVAHIERALVFRNDDIAMQKRPFPLKELDQFTLGKNSVTRAALEFLDLEHETSRGEALKHLGQPPLQRVRSGESIPMAVTEVKEIDSQSYKLTGKLLYDPMFDSNQNQIANSCRQKGDEGPTSGSWMVANELTPEGEPAHTDKPGLLEKGVPVTVKQIDIPNRDIVIEASAFWAEQSRFNRQHRIPTTDPSKTDFHTLIRENQVLILDPRTDDLLSQRAHNILSEANNTYLTTLVEGMIDGSVTNPITTAFSKSHTDEFIQWMIDNADPNKGLFAPNKNQREFIEQITGQISLLQGPPGTGKTSLTMAPALLARVYSFAKDGKKLSGAAVGESNKAVDELLGETADLLETYEDSGHSSLFRNLEMVRLVSEKPDNPHPKVTYVNYNADKEAVEAIVERLKTQQNRTQQTFGTYDDNELDHLLLFTTPSRLYGLLGKMDHDIDESVPPEEWAAMNASFFDLMAVDEASMMRLPSFLMSGAFIHDHAQVLIGGDQRQMPPVTTHNWEHESRRIIEEYVPYLSTLDYMRLLSGKDVDVVHTPEEAISADVDIPMAQLQETYRCHVTIADFLKDNMYSKDGINYRSTQTHTLESPTPQTTALEKVLDQDHPLVLILHDNDTNQQANPEETVLAKSIIADVSANDSGGIVTPHNAQRGLMNANLPDNTEVDTVERFQGGQRDMILVSATASDPDFLKAESDFILNPNRLNVAMSRMKKKLIVIASREVFNMVPSDVKKYNQALLWKGLYNEMQVNDNDPDWEGEIDDFIPAGMGSGLQFDGETSVSVYTK